MSRAPIRSLARPLCASALLLALLSGCASTGSQPPKTADVAQAISDFAVEVLRGATVDIDVDMGLGTVSAALLVGDLSAGYVAINAEYTT